MQVAHRYLTYLPQDNDGLSDAQSEQVLQAINDDLGSLLSASVDDFWEIMESNASLLSCLDSYLRFARSAACLQMLVLPAVAVRKMSLMQQQMPCWL